MLHIVGHFTAISAVTVANGEEMTMTQAQNVWVRQVSVLVLLVRVVSSDATLSCKGELSDHICNFRWVLRGELLLALLRLSALDSLAGLTVATKVARLDPWPFLVFCRNLFVE